MKDKDSREKILSVWLGFIAPLHRQENLIKIQGKKYSRQHRKKQMQKTRRREKLWQQM